MTKKLNIEETTNEVSQTFFIDSNVPLIEKNELFERIREGKRQLLSRATGVDSKYFITRSVRTVFFGWSEPFLPDSFIGKKEEFLLVWKYKSTTLAYNYVRLFLEIYVAISVPKKEQQEK